MKYITLLTIIPLSQQLTAQDSLKIDTSYLNEIIVTYQANKKTPIPHQNSATSEIDIKSTGQEPSFIFAETPSITNYSDAGNSQGYSYLRLRGIDQTRINVTLDGVPLNEPEDQGAYFSNFPDILNSVNKVQIQRGVGASKNGTASFGGSIELFSPNLKDAARTTFGLGYGSFNSFRVFGEHNSGVKNKKALYIRASQIYSDGYKYHSSNNSQSVFVSGGLFHEKSTWKANLLVGQQQNGMAWLGVSDSIIDVDPRSNANASQEKDRFLQGLAQLQNTWKINKTSSLQSSVYYSFLKGNYDFDFNNFLGFPSTEELYNYAFQSNLIGFYSNYTLEKKDLRWTTGVHGNVYKRTHTGSEKTLGELYFNTGYKNEASAFTKVNYEIIKWLTLFADVQYRYVDFAYEGSVAFDKLNWQFINPIAGVSALINSNSNARIYYSIASTGREPTRNDMFGGNDDLVPDSLGNAILFNTTAESVIDHELGFRYYKDKLDFSANAYYMDFKNEIVLDGKFGPNGLALTNNVEQSIRMGFELTLTYKIGDHFALINNSSFNYSRIKEQSEEFSPILTPPLIINQEVAYTLKDFTISASARYQDQSFIDFANSATVSSYVLVNARASYKMKGFLFTLFANNITNVRYFNNGYVDFDGSNKYFIQAPFNVYGAIQYSF